MDGKLQVIFFWRISHGSWLWAPRNLNILLSWGWVFPSKLFKVAQRVANHMADGKHSTRKTQKWDNKSAIKLGHKYISLYHGDKRNLHYSPVYARQELSPCSTVPDRWWDCRSRTEWWPISSSMMYCCYSDYSLRWNRRSSWFDASGDYRSTWFTYLLYSTRYQRQLFY